uniref:Uncharacterized protein n=1 Tax=Thermosporothrix sp. COM3 TaxID=2490863 RepID=A0A455SVZ9_9CHLR|nr:hypothetical protein KTC_64490 [Thermosporothrix sp. COM3]
MIDNDELTPIIGKWRDVFEKFLRGEPSSKIASEALQVAEKMFEVGYGCPVFPQLEAALHEYNRVCLQNSLLIMDMQNRLSQQLVVLTAQVKDHRVSHVAIRTARRIAIELTVGVVPSLQSDEELSTYLATEIVKDVICHCCLDAARAISVGGIYADNAKAFEAYRAVLQCLEAGARQVGQQLRQ